MKRILPLLVVAFGMIGCCRDVSMRFCQERGQAFAKYESDNYSVIGEGYRYQITCYSNDK